MRYASTILYVPDAPAAVEFYRRAFGLEPGFSAPDDSYATLAGEGGMLAFAAHAPAPGAVKAAPRASGSSPTPASSST